MISELVVESRLPVGFISEQDAGLIHERARDRDALPLAARQLVRLVIHAIGEADPLQGPRGPRAPAPCGEAGVDQRQLHVVQRVGARQQVERLEDEPDSLLRMRASLVVLEVTDLLAVEPVLAARGVSRQRRGSSASTCRSPKAHDPPHTRSCGSGRSTPRSARTSSEPMSYSRVSLCVDDDVGERRSPVRELLHGGPHERFAFAVSLDSRWDAPVRLP